jgi:hypothetical protein
MNYAIPTITVQRPWAPLIVGGYKTLENRNFCPATPRAALLIHCGMDEPDPATNEIALGRMHAAGFTAKNMLNNAKLAKPGHIIGIARLDALHFYNTEGICTLEKRLRGLPRTQFEMQCLQIWRNKDYSRGWELSIPASFADPIPMSGKQGLFWWTHQLSDKTRNDMAGWITKTAKLYTPHQIRGSKTGEGLVGWYSDGGAEDFIAHSVHPKDQDRHGYRPVVDTSNEPANEIAYCHETEAMLNIPLTVMGAAHELRAWLNCGIALDVPFASAMMLCKLMEDDLEAEPGSDRDWLQSLKVLVQHQLAKRMAMKEALK